MLSYSKATREQGVPEAALLRSFPAGKLQEQADFQMEVPPHGTTSAESGVLTQLPCTPWPSQSLRQ